MDGRLEPAGAFRPRVAGERGARVAAWLGVAIFGLSLSATELRAQPLAPVAAPASVSAAASAPAVAEYENVSRGAIVDFGYGSSMAGDSLLGELGGQFVGIRSFRDRSLLVQWNGLLAARGGILGNTHPYTELIGGHAVAAAEAGYRWQRRQRWSVYTGVGIGGELTVLDHPGTPFDRLDTINDVDGVGGFNARGAIRVGAGASLLDGAHSLLLVGFFQEALRAAGVSTPGTSFSQGGIALRWDVAGRLTASLEGLAGISPTTTQSGLDTTDRKTDVALAAVVRKIFSNGMWVAATSNLGREMDHRLYLDSGTAYDTADAWTFDVTVFFGVPIPFGRRKEPASPQP